MNKLSIFSLSFLFMMILFACEPQEDDKIDIGAPPESASFSIQPSADKPNTYIFTGTTEGAFLFFWDFGSGSAATGQTVERFFPEKGTYEVTLTVFTKGGSAEGTQSLIVPEDAPFDCESDAVYKYLSNCGQKTWRLNPVEGSLWVGPADGSTTWWAIPQSDVTARSCAFNDEWTFTVDGEMIYETHGDIFAEEYMGFPFECIDETQLSAAQAPWGAGTHNFLVLPGSPPQLQVNGLGAFIGLPKVANGAEVTLPQTSVTYNIIKMEPGPVSDFLELEVNIGAGIWRFQLVSE